MLFVSIEMKKKQKQEEEQLSKRARFHKECNEHGNTMNENVFAIFLESENLLNNKIGNIRYAMLLRNNSVWKSFSAIVRLIQFTHK